MAVDTTKTFELLRWGLDVHKSVTAPTMLGLIQSNQIDFFPELTVGTAFPGPSPIVPGADMSVTDVAEYRLWGGFQPYNLFLREDKHLPVENDVISIQQLLSDKSHVKITAEDFGVRQVLMFCVGGGSGHKRTHTFVVDDEIRDLDGNIVTTLNLAVDDVVELTFFGGFKGDILWTDTTGGILSIAPNDAPQASVTALMAGSTTLRAVGLNGNNHDVAVTVT